MQSHYFQNIVIGAFCIFLLGWCVNYCSKLSDEEAVRLGKAEPIAEAEERSACLNAEVAETPTFAKPIWRYITSGQWHFYCADENGVLTPVLEPDCNTRALRACHVPVEK